MLSDHIDTFIEYLKSGKNASKLTLISYRTDLNQFLTYLSLEKQIESGAIAIDQLNHGTVKNYLVNMQRDGFSRATIARKHATIRSFVRYLCSSNIIPGNPIASVELPREERPMKEADLNSIEIFLSAPNENKASGMRDKTIMELLYFGRLRISEIAAINLGDIDEKKKIIRITLRDDREKLITTSKRVRASIKKYLEHARPPLMSGNGKGEEALFISKNGSRLTGRAIRSIINKYIDRIAIEHAMSTQAMRFSMAYQFVKGGADMKAVQEIFGLARVSVSNLYSQMDKERRSEYYRDSYNRG